MELLNILSYQAYDNFYASKRWLSINFLRADRAWCLALKQRWPCKTFLRQKFSNFENNSSISNLNIKSGNMHLHIVRKEVPAHPTHFKDTHPLTQLAPPF